MDKQNLWEVTSIARCSIPSQSGKKFERSVLTGWKKRPLRFVYRLNEVEETALCGCVTQARADCIKTSTGFGSAGAALEDVKLFCPAYRSGSENKKRRGYIGPGGTGGLYQRREQSGRYQLGLFRNISF
jgi:hypothetical protein